MKFLLNVGINHIPTYQVPTIITGGGYNQTNWPIKGLVWPKTTKNIYKHIQTHLQDPAKFNCIKYHETSDSKLVFKWQIKPKFYIINYDINNWQKYLR